MDRYDEVEEYTTEHGAHRADFHAPKTTQLNWIIVVAGIMLALGVFSFLLLPEYVKDWQQEEPSPSPEVVAQPSPSHSPIETETESAPESPELETELSQTPTPEATEEPTQETEPVAEPNYQATIEVFNAAGIEGLAAQGAQNLNAGGFYNTYTGNWQGFPVGTSTVFYSEDQATAEAVAEVLGIPAVQDNRLSGITVVLTG